MEITCLSSSAYHFFQYFSSHMSSIFLNSAKAILDGGLSVLTERTATYLPFIFSGKRLIAFALKGVIGCFSEIVFMSGLMAKPTFIPSPENGNTESAV